MDGDLLEELAAFRSSARDPRHQPDPVVLRALVAHLRTFRDEATSFGVAEEFLRGLIGDFIACLRKLDALPRDDPFWEGTNRRPTQYKLAAFCQRALEAAPEDVLAHRMQSAVQVLFGHFFDPLVWSWLRSHGQTDASGPVYSALLAIYFGGYETFPQLLELLTDEGLCDDARPVLDDLIQSGVPWVVDWARRVIKGCKAVARRTEGSGPPR